MGYAELSMTAVAARAGTSKSVLYRRWPSRARIVFAAMRQRHPSDTSSVPDTGKLRSDLIAAMLQAASAVEGVSPQTLWALMSDSVNDAELSEAVRRDYGDTETSSWMGTIVGRAVTRGEITVASMTVRQRALAMQLMRDQVVTAGQITATDITEMVDEILLPMLHSG